MGLPEDNRAFLGFLQVLAIATGIAAIPSRSQRAIRLRYPSRRRGGDLLAGLKPIEVELRALLFLPQDIISITADTVARCLAADGVSIDDSTQVEFLSNGAIDDFN